MPTLWILCGRPRPNNRTDRTRICSANPPAAGACRRNCRTSRNVKRDWARRWRRPAEWMPSEKIVEHVEANFGQKLDRAAFVYDARQDCYYCPAGRKLPFRKTQRFRPSQGRMSGVLGPVRMRGFGFPTRAVSRHAAGRAAEPRESDYATGMPSSRAGCLAARRERRTRRIGTSANGSCSRRRFIRNRS